MESKIVSPVNFVKYINKFDVLWILNLDKNEISEKLIILAGVLFDIMQLLYEILC